jgi:hypothetical protein
VSSLSDVFFTDLNDDQVEALFFRLDWHRLWLERLHARIVAKGFPPRDAFRQRVRSTLAAQRELALFLNDGRRKGRASPYLKRARHWPRI